MILAIDPGPEQSAFTILDGQHVCVAKKIGNTEMAQYIEQSLYALTDCVIEMIASYGMPVGEDVFETCVWIGRFVGAAERRGGLSVHRIKRQAVKMHHCFSMRAKDSHVRQAILDRYGGKAKAIGRKHTAGPLYFVKNDMWQALALGLYFLDTLHEAARGDGRGRE